jgi:hypothetical protein
MSYDRQILKILTDVGELGIGVQQLAKHVYNLNCSLFSQPNLQEIHTYVQQYLLKNSKSTQSLIESTGRRGYYRLNTQNNADARQLVLEFREQAAEPEEEKEEKPQKDFSLNLFD